MIGRCRDNGRTEPSRRPAEGARAPVDELEIPLDQINEETRLREDLDADSLDLYELVMELEDTYGISVSEEEAADIETVGRAVDFVAGRLGVAA